MNGDARPERLRIEGLCKAFFGVRVLHEVSFAAHGGRVLGIVGENGSGKSTAMNLLTGVLPRDAGAILLDGQAFEPLSRRASESAGIAFIQQELNVFANLSVAENLFLVRQPRSVGALPWLSRRALAHAARELLAQVDLQVSPHEPAASLSAGERQLLEIARGLASNARVFILDEPTSSLTGREKTRLFEIIRRLQERDVAVLYISHDLEDILALADDLLVMRDGHVVLHAARAGVGASDLVLAMVGRPIDALFPERVAVSGAAPVLQVKGLSEPGALSDISLEVGAGEIVGIAGLMGSGRSELARAIFGLDSHAGGSVLVKGTQLRALDVAARLGAGVALLTEDRRHEGLMLDASVADNMALAALPKFSRGGRVREGAIRQVMQALATRLNLKSGPIDTTAVRTLSGGNQQKVVLARWLMREPSLFILDEPTRGVDIGAKQEIYRLLGELSAQGVAILIISSELEELLGLCDRIHVMRRGALGPAFARAQFERASILSAAFGQDIGQGGVG